MLRTIPYQRLDIEKKKKILQWRNDYRIRKFMKHDSLISYEEHIKFIESLKLNRNRHYFLVVDDEIDIGTVNLNRIDSSTVEGGLFKNPEIERSVGSLLLDRLELEAVKHNYSTIVLKVQKNNHSAQRLYERAGYRKNEVIEDLCTYIKDDITRTIIIAELSANHNQSIFLAKESIKAAAEAGADAVKIQTYTADTITIDCDNDFFKIDQGTLWDGRTLYDLYNEAYTPWEWYDELRDLAESYGLVFFSTPFDKTAVDFLDSKDVPWYKIASFEITDIPLIEYTASKGKPIILSTGVADFSDIQLAVDTCKNVGNFNITLLQCTSSYPAPIDAANLRMIPDMANTFDVKVGLSDHTLGSVVALAGVALGAKLVEKHFILSREMGGPDSHFSIEPTELSEMIDNIRIVERALGKVDYTLNENKKKNRKFSRSLFAVENIPAGAIITENNVRSIRPGDGLHPRYYSEILGMYAKVDIIKGTPIDKSFLR